MSFIDKALERAKAHKKKEQAGSAVVPEALAPRIPLTRPSESTEREIIPPEISYSITRTVAVDREVMRQNRLIVPGEETEGAVGEGYKLLRTHILHRTKAEGHNTLMITGPRQGEGKTLTAINLAISIAQEVNHTVLLVDADLRFPSVHRYFGIHPKEGLVDYLTAGVPLSELLIHPEGIAKLALLPVGERVAQGTELISSPLMADLVQELKHFIPTVMSSSIFRQCWPLRMPWPLRLWWMLSSWWWKPARPPGKTSSAVRGC